MNHFHEVALTGLGAIATILRGDLMVYGDNTIETNAAGFVEDFVLENYLPSQKNYLDRCSAMALVGCTFALRDAKIETPVSDENFGITLGTHWGCVDTMKGFWDKALEKGTRLANPILFSHSYFNSPTSLCAIEFGLKGYHATFCANEYSGLEAVRAAYDAIRLGHADAMLCGAVEAYSPTRALCEQNVTENEGTINEAAVFFVLEKASRAAARSGQSTLPTIDESWFEIDLETARGAYGYCGGALSAIALMDNVGEYGLKCPVNSIR